MSSTTIEAGEEEEATEEEMGYAYLKICFILPTLKI
jgi:hypothetical protein